MTNFKLQYGSRTLKRFADFNNERLDEGIVRSGAVSMFANSGRKHGDNAAQHFRFAKQELLKLKRLDDIERKIDMMAASLDATLDGLIELRHQIGSISAQVTSAAILNKDRR